MSWLVLDKSKCKQDGVCVAVCPSSALGRDEQGGPVELAQKRCIQCGHCVAVCPTEAIALESLPQEPMLPAPREPIAPELFDAFATSLRSIREFKDEPVDRDAFAAMLDVARRASTAVNRQGLHWIAVSGKDKVHAIAEAVFAGLDASMRSPRAIELFESGHDFLLRNAPSLAVCCAPLASD